MSDETPRCRPVEVDGVTVRAYGVGELTDHDRAVIAETVAELRRREDPGDTEVDPDVCPTCGRRVALHADCEPTDRCPACRALCDCYPEETPDE